MFWILIVVLDMLVFGCLIFELDVANWTTKWDFMDFLCNVFPVQG